MLLLYTLNYLYRIFFNHIQLQLEFNMGSGSLQTSIYFLYFFLLVKSWHRLLSNNLLKCYDKVLREETMSQLQTHSFSSFWLGPEGRMCLAGQWVKSSQLPVYILTKLRDTIILKTWKNIFVNSRDCFYSLVATAVSKKKNPFQNIQTFCEKHKKISLGV